ncbi:SoxH protein, homolog [hydrothermal vent metagenome]|uniref:SoxH protein, homolog n=1 Tax=hydrothermal vent metagenome TaxID=652676 RepID=A0A1W1DWF2_9ZZZZ
MKKLTLLLALALSTLSHAWTIDGYGNYKFEAISKNVYVIHGPLDEPNAINQGFMNNPGMVIGADGVIVVDPGGSYHTGKRVIGEVKKVTDKPIVAVFNTHVHGDHWLGNQAIIEQYPNAKIYAHPQMIAEAKGGEGEYWIDLIERLTEGVSKGTIATYPTDATSHLQTITVGSEQFRIHNPTTKAHTATDIMIEHVGSKTLFLGDNDMIHRLGGFGGTSDMHSNIKVLNYATNLNLNHYVPGHGPSGDAEHAVKPYLDYLLILQDEARKGYEEDLADYEIRPAIVKKLDDYKDWHSLDNNLGRHINKMLLEVEALDL